EPRSVRRKEVFLLLGRRLWRWRHAAAARRTDWTRGDLVGVRSRTRAARARFRWCFVVTGEKGAWRSPSPRGTEERCSPGGSRPERFGVAWRQWNHSVWPG